MSPSRPISDSPVRPQYTPLIRRCSVRTYSMLSLSCDWRLMNPACMSILSSEEASFDADVSDAGPGPASVIVGGPARLGCSGGNTSTGWNT